MNRLRALHRRRGRGARTRKQSPPGRPRPFDSVDALLEAARQMFRARSSAARAEMAMEDRVAGEKPPEEEQVSMALEEERAWSAYWHRSFKLSTDAVGLCRVCREHVLDPIEVEILAALVLDRLALIDESVRTCGDVLAFMNLDGKKSVDVLRKLSENGRLLRSRLLSYEDEYDDIRDRSLLVDPVLVDSVLFCRPDEDEGWRVSSEEELYDRLQALNTALAKKAEDLGFLLRGHGRHSDFYRVSRRVDHLLKGLKDTLNLHPDWKLGKLQKKAGGMQARKNFIILLVLLAREFGHLADEDRLYQGKRLALASASSTTDVESGLRHLGPGSKLVSAELIQPSGGMGTLVSDDPRELEQCEFELTDKSIEILGLNKSRFRKKRSSPEVREPKVLMRNLVLPEKVKKALKMASAQARHAKLLMEDWGLGRMVPYGRAVTLLFSGPPGVGKTACAEALAHKLKKPILVADYSRIQNCFVGQTEKNIVSAFRTATQTGAVLFWDEADAMFYTREMATRTWEARDVNVLLQELERFEGVCVLATNRKVILDPALERRIALKVEFDRPDREMRKRIWRKFLTGNIPLADDVDIDTLCEADLTGGEIKNAVLNAARIALCRGGKKKVRMRDLIEACEMESGHDVFFTDRSIGFRLDTLKNL